MSNIKFNLSILLLGLVFLGGCTFGLGPNQPTDDGTVGGLYRSADGGATWQQAVLLAGTNVPPQNIAGLNVLSLVLDPSDSKALYYASLDNGLFYSYNGAKSWQPALELGPRSIGDVAVDPQDKCTIYVVSYNKVFKSGDCNRTWQEMYSDNNPNIQFTSVAVDQYDSRNVFIGNTRGDIIRSQDYGQTWQTLHNFDGVVKEIAISPHDSRIMMLTTADASLFRSMDNGKTWQSLKKILQAYKSSAEIRDIAPSPSEPGGWLLAARYGLFKTNNDGDTWVEIQLIPPEKETRINTVAIGNDPNRLYYATNTTFYASFDAGVNWRSQQLPTPRRGWRLLLDPKDDNLVYLGVSQKPN